MTRSLRWAARSALALVAAAPLLVSGSAIAAADEPENIHITIVPDGAGGFILSHPTLTVEIGTVLTYTKAFSAPPYHILEHIDVVPGNTYQQNRTRCVQAYTNFDVECHWIDIALGAPLQQCTLGAPGSPNSTPPGNGLFYGVKILPPASLGASPTYIWDTGVWYKQHVQGYLGRSITAPRELILIDALNSQKVVQRVTLVPPETPINPAPLTCPAPTPTPTPEPDATPTPTPTPDPDATPTPTPTPNPTPTPTPTPAAGSLVPTLPPTDGLAPAEAGPSLAVLLPITTILVAALALALTGTRRVRRRS